MAAELPPLFVWLLSWYITPAWHDSVSPICCCGLYRVWRRRMAAATADADSKAAAAAAEAAACREDADAAAKALSELRTVAAKQRQVRLENMKLEVLGFLVLHVLMPLPRLYLSCGLLPHSKVK